MSNQFDQKVVVITGGTTGIGRASVKQFADSGATVVATGTNPETLEAASKEFPNVEFISSDAADASSVEALFEHVKNTHGRVDVLFLNAGIATPGTLTESTEEQFDKLFNINVKGVWLGLKYATPLLSEGASVTVTSSVVSQRPFEGFGLYSATKAALRGILRAASLELKEKGIRVNAVAPGPVDTPIFGKIGVDDESAQAFGQTVTAGRLGRPEEIADAVLFLASDKASYINGVELNVDGGFVY